MDDLRTVIREGQADDPDLRVGFECPLPGATNGIAMTTPLGAKIVIKLVTWGEFISETKVLIGRSKSRVRTSIGLDDGYLP